MQTPVSLFADTAEVVEVQSAPASASVGSVNVEVPASIEALAEEAADCRLCGLCESRNQVVFGTGDPHADLLLIGEAPGREEDRLGEPFVGRAGQLLDRMLHAMQLDRQQVYIMNTIKCRPPNNRDPNPDEIEACRTWFDRQLALLQPKVICLLGRVAARTILARDESLGVLRGQWHDCQGVPALVTYHPAYLLRTPSHKQRSWQDLMMLSDRLCMR